MIVKVHSTGDGKKIVAVCDNNLLGKKFEENGLQLDLTGNFYKGEQMSDEQILKAVKNAYIINIVGEDSINFFIGKKIIEKVNVLKIKNVPHAQLLLM